jgi:uncharacterized protein YndB with AHSA1/START domain
MNTTTTPDLGVTRIVNAPRALVYKAFTEPAQFAQWWGPIGNSLPQDGLEFDVRPGGHIGWREVFPAQPDTWTRGRIDLTEVVDGELLDGVMRITGQLPGGFEPFETRVRVEFHDESDGRTRLEISQWLPDSYVAPTQNGWGEAFAKLDAVLAGRAS